MKYLSSLKTTVKDITLISMMVAVIEVCKVTMSFLPNIELTSFWVIIFSLYFKKRIYLVIIVFILVEGLLYGFGLWWIMYIYTWPLLAFISMKLKNNDSAIVWGIISGVFGLLFGLLCSLPYFAIGAAGGSLMDGFNTAFTWWVAGIPWDIVHGVSNMILMMILYYPITKVMRMSKYRLD